MWLLFVKKGAIIAYFHDVGTDPVQRRKVRTQERKAIAGAMPLSRWGRWDECPEEGSAQRDGKEAYNGPDIGGGQIWG